MMMVNIVFVLHFAATLFMVGVIWFVQVVHYPLFTQVGCSHFSAYEESHQRLTTGLVAPPMLLEMLTALLLLWWRPSWLPISAVVAGLTLLALIWLSTAFVQVPKHEKLAKLWDEEVVSSLVHTNWIRTILWSARGILLMCFVAGALPFAR